MKKILLIFFLFSIPSAVFGAELQYIRSSEDVLSVGASETISVLLNSESVMVNAVEGEVIIPLNFSIVGVEYGESIITHWLEQPILKEDARRIQFSGFTPGGFIASSSLLFTLYVRADNEGDGYVSTQNLKVLQHDGKGTLLPAQDREILLISKAETMEKKNNIPENFDEDAPEIFTPQYVVSKEDDTIFVSWRAVDKGKGVKEEYLKVGEFGRYHKVEHSQFSLKPWQQFFSIYIKIVDGSDNERIVFLQPYKKIPHIFIVTVSVCFIFVLLLALYLVRRR